MAEKAPIIDLVPNAQTHQMSGCWLVVFWTFEEPRAGIFNSKDPQAKMKISKRYIVKNDAVSCRVSRPKGNHLKSASVKLKLTDTKYDELVRPKDYVAIWMCRWQEDIDRVIDRLQSNQPANFYESGLKFVGRVSTLSRSASVEGSTGTPDEYIDVAAEMFTELDTSVYVSRLIDFLNNPAGNNSDNMGFFSTLQQLDPNQWAELNASPSGLITPDRMLRILTSIFLKSGPASDPVAAAGGAKGTLNTTILVPQEVRSLLGAKEKDYLSSTLFYTGIEHYDNNSFFKPISVSKVSGPFHESKALKGAIATMLGNWDNSSLFSLLRQYLNDTVNELYTTMRYDPIQGIRPSIVARQIPFSTPFIQIIKKNMQRLQLDANDQTLTYFNNIPRWRVAPELITSVNLGFGFGDHINAVRIMLNAASLSYISGLTPEEQTSVASTVNEVDYTAGNFFYDPQDVVRHGLTFNIQETIFDIDSSNKINFLSPLWTAMRADFQVNMDMKLSGRISTFGIQEPICEGDNFELDNVIYHIEGLDHLCQIFPGGAKKFITQLSLSHGTDKRALEDEASALKYFPATKIPAIHIDFSRTESQAGSKK